MEENKWFENWFNCPYYKVLYKNRDILEASRFIDVLIDYLKPLPGSKMLDIACGEGRFSIHLAEKGFDVTGIDLASNSIEQASKHTCEHLHFFVHDMRLPFKSNYFDYAFNFFTSFGYFENYEDNLAAVRSFADGLKKGGMLVMDYFNRDYVLQHLVPDEIITRGNTEFRVKRTYDGEHVIKNIHFSDETGIERNFTERVSAFNLTDFMTLFNDTGMSLVDTFGDYNLSPYHPLDMPRLIMIFKKL